MMKQLRPYQEEDVNKLISRQAMGNFNEQRTGKTPTSLVACQKYGATKILIVAPASLLYNWAQEYEDWLGQPCVVVKGTKLQKIKQIATWTHGLAINYESLRVSKTSDGLWELIKKHKPDAIIVDEAHRIKGRTNATAKAIFKFKRVPYKLALTGTPAPNKPDEVWAILHFLYPDNFPGYRSFIETWFSYRDTPYNEFSRDVFGIKPELVNRFQNMLNAISINRKRKDVMPWLPDTPPPMQIRLPLAPAQEKHIDNLMNVFETDDLITQGVLDRLMRIRQICMAPKLLELSGPSPKLNWIKEYLADYPDRPTIMFSRFTSWLRYVEKETDGKIKVYDGSVSLQDRADLINQFQSGKINVLAIQIDAGKEGLTLDRAECLIFTDVYPEASDIQQARDRIVATTPDKAHIPKQVIELMMRDSYDESLYQLVKQNATATDVINSFHKYIKQRRVM